ncbi:hypothetical protein OHC33_002079, partial [Knufia fluminis]
NGDPSITFAPKRSSIISANSASRQPTGFSEMTTRSEQARPSALPRSTSSSSQARLSYIASTRPAPTYASTPPSEGQSLAATITYMPKLNSSRAFLGSDPHRQQHTESLSPMDMYDDTVLGIAMPEKQSTYPPATLPPRLIPELQALAASTYRPTNPASSSITSISSPSTQFTASSSPWSAWSASTAATTPVSWSSASPSISQAAHVSSKRSHTVPMPSNVKIRTPKLPAVKENRTSASSTMATFPTETERAGRKLRKTNTPDPTPPPRSSSLKSTRSRSNSAVTYKSEKQSALNPSIMKPLDPSVTSRGTALPADGNKEASVSERKPDMVQGHSRLQEAINCATQPTAARVPPQSTQQQTSSVPSQSHARQLLEPLPVEQTQHRRFPSLSRRHERQTSTSEPEVEKQSARSRLAKFSRLALFGKSKPTAESEAKAQKLQPRKGPAAGTGHEGYARFGRRGRKQSISSSVGATDSETSIASVTRRPIDKKQSRVSSSSQDQSDLDEFASSRLKPVVMIGGSRRGRANPFPSMPKNPQLSDISLSTVSSTENYSTSTRVASPRRERLLTDREDIRPTLATRRSQKLARSDEPFRFPGPIETQGLATTPCLDSKNTTQSSDLATPASTTYKLDSHLLEKQRTKGRKSKWNIFRRKDSISEAVKLKADGPQVRPGMSVDVAPGPSSRPVPFYAMLGSESEVNTTAAIGQFLREAAESPEKEDGFMASGFSDDEVIGNPHGYRESILLPSAPVRHQQQVQISVPASVARDGSFVPTEWPLGAEMSEDLIPSKKQPRLAHVGRIPKVVPTRNLPQPGVQVAHTPQMPVLRHVTEPIRPKASREQLPRLTTGRPPIFRRRESGESKTQEVPNRLAQPRRHQSGHVEPEFLQYSGGRNSDFTTSSESTGIISIMGPPASDVTYIPSRPATHLPHEDDVWNEYNDFMDDIMSPSQQSNSLSSKKSKRSEHAGRGRGKAAVPTRDNESTKGLAIIPTPIPAAGPSRQFLGAPALAHVPSLQEMASSEEIRLRRSRIAAALHASYAPSSPFSMRDFIEEYDRPSSGKFSERLSGSSVYASTPTYAFAQPQREHSRPRQYENAAQLEEVERTRNPTKHSDRSYASLMVSRWLSFGRVLFSPAQQEIEANPEKHVLVIDGLGSEDWSIYCAVTYEQEKVYVHDLKERRQGRAKVKAARTAESAPSNHRRSEISSFTDRFPFPPGFFCAIVVRFPPAMPDSKLKNIVSECRRVLAPGGYLELMVLDLDIVNMGVQTRRAVKDLKIKMTAADRTVSLKPIIDNVQTVLGSNGFSNLSRCIVGVPVVGKPAGSLDSSSESRSSTESMASRQRRSSAGPRPYGSLGGQANFSLNDLVADYSENADAKIGKMVSRTARSWWQHCFEAGMIADGNTSRSVFANKEVLKECKTRASNFKLLIAYTQKPQLEQKRRTMSEPTVPTLATAGVGRPRKQAP